MHRHPGRPACAIVCIPVGGCVGRSILTLEGLGSRDQPDPIQSAFIAEEAAQWRYCLNGMIMMRKPYWRGTPARPNKKAAER